MVPTEYIVEVTNNVLSTMLASPATVNGRDEVASLNNRMTGCVQISGAWSGAVLVQTSQQFACKAASKLLQMNADEVQHEDMQDTLAELTNMIGGNIKSVVPGPSFLSLPSVTTGQDFDFKLFGAELVNTVPFECNGEGVRVLLCQGINNES